MSPARSLVLGLRIAAAKLLIGIAACSSERVAEPNAKHTDARRSRSLKGVVWGCRRLRNHSHVEALFAQAAVIPPPVHVA